MVDLALGQKLSDLGREYSNAAIGALQSDGKVHPPTAIAGCARMAGTLMFRSFGLKLEGVAPGQAVLSKEGATQSSVLSNTTVGILANLKVAIAAAPSGPLVGKAFKPPREFLATQRLLEPLFAPIQAKHGLTARQAAQGAAIATALLIHHFAKHMDPNAGFGLAVFSFAEGCQTAPDPVSL